jgi:aminoglycoside phosphotransferase (APT) family kinase protein
MAGTRDTAPIRPEEQFDEQRLAAYLKRNLEEFGGPEPIEFEQFPGGHANLTYLARIGNREYVLRRPPLGPVAPKSHDMVRESKVLHALSAVLPQAPAVYHLCEDEAVLGKPFFVMERKRGFVIRNQWPAGVPDSTEIRRTISEEFIDTLIALHRVDYDAIGLGDLGRPEGFVARQVYGWGGRWEQSKTRDVEAMDRLAVWLEERLPEPQAASLLHNDYKLDNVMIDDAGHVVAVLDWDMATLGDPLMDLGTTLAYWSQPTDLPYRIFMDNPLLHGGFLTRAGLVDRYRAGTGLDLSGLRWYEVFAFFKIAVIVEQIYARYVAGQTSDERFAGFGTRVEQLSAAALELAEA